MKILFISPRYRGGGAERCARELFLGMRERGHITEMWTAVPEENVPAGVHYVRTFAERLLYPVNYIDPVADWRHISTRRKLDAIQPGDFDVVHLHNIHGHWISIKALHRLCQRLPVVWTLHDEWAATGGVPCDLSRTSQLREQLDVINRPSALHYPLSANERNAVKWKSYLARWLPQPQQLTAPSQHMIDLTNNSGHFSNGPVALVRPGLQLLNCPAILMPRTEARRQWKLPDDQKVILFVSPDFASPYKGAWLGSKVLNIFTERYYDQCRFSLLLLGRRPEQFSETLDRRINVRSGFATTNQELASAYRSASLTLVPSIADNFPFVALESFACGTPVLSFRIGGLTEIVGNNERGTCVEPFDTESMVKALLDILQDDERRENKATAARSWVEQISNNHNYFAKFETIYDQLSRPETGVGTNPRNLFTSHS